MLKPELIFYNGMKLHEAMHWDPINKVIYFAAIRYNMIYELDPKNGAITSYKTEGPVGGAVNDKDGNIIEAEKSGIYKINKITKEKVLLHHILPYEKMRYNHLVLDSKGRILVDIMGDEERCAGRGGLYQIDGDKNRCLVDGTTVANGIALSSDEKLLYFTDTVTKTVQCYDYDIETGDIANGRTVIVMPEEEPGKPDGLMLDKEGYLWIAEWAGERLSKWNPDTGLKVGEVIFPSAHVTSSCIGGEDQDYIYVATAKQEVTDEEPSGGIFRIPITAC